MKLLNILLLAVFLILPVAVHAAEETPAATEVTKQDPADLDKRLELAKKRQALMPVSVRDQINAAIDEVAKSQPDKEREIFRTNMRSILNYQALEKISIEAIAETYTVAELEAQIEYYSKPEAQSSEKKYSQYAEKVYPEITRMLDQALMRVRTGGQ